MEIIDVLICFFMIIISTFLTVPGQPSPRFHVEALSVEISPYSARAATYISKTIHGIEIKFSRVIENHKLINLV